jgi:hypothetical protein
VQYQPPTHAVEARHAPRTPAASTSLTLTLTLALLLVLWYPTIALVVGLLGALAAVGRTALDRERSVRGRLTSALARLSSATARL